MNIPGIALNGDQDAKLNGLLLRGKPDLLVIDTPVNGSALYVLVARGDARAWAMSQLYGAEEKDAPASLGPPAKVVPVSTGAHTAQPLRKPAQPTPEPSATPPAVDLGAAIPVDFPVEPKTFELPVEEVAAVDWSGLDDPALAEMWEE